MANKIFLLTIIFCVIGCRNSSNNTPFKSVYNISSSILVQGEKLYDPWDIVLIDSLIIIANQKGEPLIEVYDVSGKLIQNFLTKGKGPEEILMVGGLQQRIGGNKQLLVYDLFQKKFLQYDLADISSIMIDKPTIALSYYRQHTDTLVLFDKLILGNQWIIGESRSLKGRIALMNMDGSLIKYTGDYPPEINPKLGDYENANLYASGIALNSDGSRMALATYAAGLIDLYEISSNSVKPLWSYKEFVPNHLEIIEMGEVVRAAFTKKSRYGYPDITASDRFVYALFSGKKFEEPNYSFGKTIRCISWDLSVDFELHTDVNVNRISVSKDDKTIYAIAMSDDTEPEIVSFDISHIINNINHK